MKSGKRLVALGLSLAMMFTAVCGTPATAEAAAKKSATVSTQKKLDKALKAKKTTKITIKTKAKKTVKIKKAKYTKKNLIVNGAKLTVKNSATFKGINIKDAVKYEENGKNNKITVSDKKLTLVIGKNATVKSVKITKKTAKISVQNQSKKSVKITLADGSKVTVKAGKKKVVKGQKTTTTPGTDDQKPGTDDGQTPGADEDQKTDEKTDDKKDETSSTGGGISGGTTSYPTGGKNPPSDKPVAVSSNCELFVKAIATASDGATVTAEKLETNDEVVATWNGTGELTIDLAANTIASFKLEALNATKININGTGKVTGKFTVKAPNAHVNYNIETGSIDVVAVSTNTIKIMKAVTGVLKVLGTARVAVADGAKVAAVTVAPETTSAEVILTGNFGTANVEITKVANVTLDKAIVEEVSVKDKADVKLVNSTVVEVSVQVENVSVTVDENSTVDVVKVDENVTAVKLEGTGEIKKVEASEQTKIEGSNKPKSSEYETALWMCVSGDTVKIATLKVTISGNTVSGNVVDANNVVNVSGNTVSGNVVTTWETSASTTPRIIVNIDDKLYEYVKIAADSGNVKIVIAEKVDDSTSISWKNAKVSEDITVEYEKENFVICIQEKTRQ